MRAVCEKGIEIYRDAPFDQRAYMPLLTGTLLAEAFSPRRVIARYIGNTVEKCVAHPARHEETPRQTIREICGKIPTRSDSGEGRSEQRMEGGREYSAGKQKEIQTSARVTFRTYDRHWKEKRIYIFCIFSDIIV